MANTKESVAAQLREWSEDPDLEDTVRSLCLTLAAKFVPPPPEPPRAGKPVCTWKATREWYIRNKIGTGREANKDLIGFFAMREARGYEDMRGGEVVEFVAEALRGEITPYTPREIDKQLQEEQRDWEDTDGPFDLRDELEEYFSVGENT